MLAWKPDVRLLVLVGLVCSSAAAVPLLDEAATIAAIQAKGAQVKEVKGAATSVTLDDGSKWTEAEFKQLGTLGHLKSLALSKCLDDRTLPLLAGLTELDTLQTNLATVTDEGVKQLLPLKKLRTLKFFHPSREFTGSGLAALAGLPNLESLTVAGSLSFGDAGMAAVGQLTQLKQLRTWHAGQTLDGLKHLKELKNLTSLTLGQRLTYTPPACVCDEMIPLLFDLRSLEFLQLEEARLRLPALVQIKQLPRLKKLNLEVVDIAETDVERLRKELPGVEIAWKKPSEIFLKRIHALFDK